MQVTESVFPDSRIPWTITLFNFHVETSLLSTCNVKGSVATGFVTLNTCSDVALLADEALQTPSTNMPQQICILVIRINCKEVMNTYTR